MNDRTFKLPNAVRMRAESQGAQGRLWMERLGKIVTEIEQAWHLQTGEPFEGGSAALVLPAKRDNGEAAVLKVCLPQRSDKTEAGDDWRREVGLLEQANGKGYAALIEIDLERHAILMEVLGAPLGTLELPADEQIEIIGQTLLEAWMPPPEDSDLLTGATKALWLADMIEECWVKLGRPCKIETRDQAVSYAKERHCEHDPSKAVLVHGDPHEFNTLQALDVSGAPTGRFKFVDPDGFIAEPAYDLGVVLRSWIDELEGPGPRSKVLKWAKHLSALTGVQTDSIWQWAFVERVSTGLHLLEMGHKVEGEGFLSVADRLV